MSALHLLRIVWVQRVRVNASVSATEVRTSGKKKTVVEAEVEGENKCTFCVCNVHNITFKITPRHITKIKIKY